MYAVMIVGAFIVAIFAVEMMRQRWRENAWRRRSREADDDRKGGGS